MNLYQDVQFVDRGRFATVLQARNIKTNQDVALKKMWVKSSLNTSHDSHQNSITASTSISPRIHKNYLAHCVEREIKILSILNKHSNIIKLLDTFKENEYVIIVLELMNIDLHQLLQNIHIQKKTLSEIECKYITKQLFEGLNALHQNHIAHRDLKPANILFNKHGILKIADLGQARIIKKYHMQNKNRKTKQHKANINDLNNNLFMVRGVKIRKDGQDKENDDLLLTNEVGTRWYKSPELLYGTRKYDCSIDIWSAGCIVAELLQCEPLFCGETDIDQLCKIFNILGTINLKYYSEAVNLPDFNKIVFNEIRAKPLKTLWPSLSDGIIDLIKCCLQFNPNSRIVTSNVLKHSWFGLKDKCNINVKKQFKKLIVNATLQLTQERKKKMESFNHNNDEDVISITSDILNECDLLDLDVN